jgi:hypothetical protein
MVASPLCRWGNRGLEQGKRALASAGKWHGWGSRVLTLLPEQNQDAHQYRC